jgi:FkbM family methyltransferase
MFRWGGAIYPCALAVGKAADILRGVWWEPELGLIGRSLRPGQTAIDTGANYGLWSYHLARAVGSRGRVLAFEPIPSTASTLRRVLWLLAVSGRVEVIRAGAGEREDQMPFQIPVSDGAIPIGGLAHVEANEARDHITITARVCRVDDVHARGDIAFLKVDVEGAELYALRGTEQTLRYHEPVIVCEIGAGLLKERYGIDVLELIGYLENLGYSGPMRYVDGRLRIVSIGDGHDDNYVFATPRRLPTLPLG